MGILEFLSAIIYIAFQILKGLAFAFLALAIAVEMFAAALGDFFFSTLPSLWQSHPVGVLIGAVVIILGVVVSFVISVLDY